MKRLLLAATLLLCAAPAYAMADLMPGIPTVCTVASMDGSLNVRTAPAGQIVGQFRNGDRVHVHADHQVRNWIWVDGPSVVPGSISGWVFRPLLNTCSDPQEGDYE